jgi:SH3-like domain-containing protein
MQKLIISIFFFLNIFTNCIAIENNYFLSLKNNKVNVRYGPGFDHPIKYIYKKKFLPVKVIDKKENFRRIIDHKHNSGWIHTSQLKKPSSVILTENQFIFTKPTKFSEPIAVAEKGKLILLNKCKKKWCKTSVEDISGWMLFDKFWGKLPN